MGEKGGVTVRGNKINKKRIRIKQSLDKGLPKSTGGRPEEGNLRGGHRDRLSSGKRGALKLGGVEGTAKKKVRCVPGGGGGAKVTCTLCVLTAGGHAKMKLADTRERIGRSRKRTDDHARKAPVLESQCAYDEVWERKRAIGVRSTQSKTNISKGEDQEGVAKGLKGGDRHYS